MNVIIQTNLLHSFGTARIVAICRNVQALYRSTIDKKKTESIERFFKKIT